MPVGEAKRTFVSVAEEVVGQLGTLCMKASEGCFAIGSAALLANQAAAKPGKADAVEHLLGRPAHLAVGAGFGFLFAAAFVKTTHRVIRSL